MRRFHYTFLAVAVVEFSQMLPLQLPGLIQFFLVKHFWQLEIELDECVDETGTIEDKGPEE